MFKFYLIYADKFNSYFYWIGFYNIHNCSNLIYQETYHIRKYLFLFSSYHCLLLRSAFIFSVTLNSKKNWIVNNIAKDIILTIHVIHVCVFAIIFWTNKIMDIYRQFICTRTLLCHCISLFLIFFLHLSPTYFFYLSYLQFNKKFYFAITDIPWSATYCNKVNWIR